MWLIKYNMNKRNFDCLACNVLLFCKLMQNLAYLPCENMLFVAINEFSKGMKLQGLQYCISKFLAFSFETLIGGSSFKGPSTRDDFVVHNLLCATCLIVWTGKSSENQLCTISRKVVHDLEKSRPMFYFGTTNSIPGVETTNHTAYFVAMTTRYDVVFYLTSGR